MKKRIQFTCLLALCAVIVVASTGLHTDVFKVDTNLSSLEWFAKKVTGEHNGTIKMSGGEISNNHGKITGTFEFDMTTIEDTDMEPGNSKTKLENHLKSPDFFDVVKYPKSKFVIKSITPVAGKEGITHLVKGDLTIKDKTNEITFDAAMQTTPNKIVCSGSAVVDRSKFDVRYGSKTFFADIGDKMIYDEFTLKFNVTAVKQ